MSHSSFGFSIPSRVLMFCTLVLALQFSTPSAIAQKRIEPNRLAVDAVSVRKLGRIHGIVLAQDDTELSIAVRREWLKSEFRDFFKEQIEAEKNLNEIERKKLRERLEEWQAERDGDDELQIREFIDQNYKLLELDKPFDATSLNFMIVKLDMKSVRRVFAQSDQKHRLAGIAWAESVENVEAKSSTLLKRELKSKEIDIEKYDLNLGNQLPIVYDTDNEWEIRKALIEFIVLPRLEYQGIGTTFYRKSAEADPMKLMQQMIQGGGFSQLDQLGKEFGLPEFQDRRNDFDDQAWLKRMIATAESEERKAFSISSLTQGDTVSINSTLYVKSAAGTWHPIKRIEASERLSDQKGSDIQAVKQDPQVEKVMQIAKQMGLGDTAVLDKAIRSGTATRNALKKVSGEMEDFLEPYSFEVDNPPVPKLLK